MSDLELTNGAQQVDLPTNGTVEAQDLFAHLRPENQPVTCLGQTFKNDAARREYFTNLLAEKLKDPEFRKIEGFPIGKDEDILALSDPPYYCACPNPWVKDFIAEWEAAKPKRSGKKYHREPFAADVSEGKTDPIYNAHSYHTKVPHKAIMRYILHYTEPGDIVFDGFCGTGMTGVAAQLCGDRKVVESLGYRVDEKGAIRDPEGEDPKKVISHLGARKAVLNDLSPAASFIAYNYNAPVDVGAFEREAKKILAEVEKEYGWMYETQHVDKDGQPVLGINGQPLKGKINYVVWSDVFICPHCQKNVVFWDVAVNRETGQVLDVFQCPHCHAEMTKSGSEHFFEHSFDNLLNREISIARQVPVLIDYSVAGEKGHFQKKLDESDRDLLNRIESESGRYWMPLDRMIQGKESRRNDKFGITNVHQFYTRRNLLALAALWHRSSNYYLRLVVTGIMQISSKQSSFRYDSRNPKNTAGGILKGTLYIPSISREGSIFENYKRRLNSILAGFRALGKDRSSMVQTGSFTEVQAGVNCCDYIFIDPPFGANINYSELNSLWEAWLKVLTNNKEEAIVNDTQKKEISDYRLLMRACLEKAYLMLKPGRWMTVEFSNTSASVWNSIQSAMADVGFIVANVSALDKKQGSFKAVTTTTAVKQDLIISAYKPDVAFELRFGQEAGTEDGVWDFVRTHLAMLPTAKMKGSQLLRVPERDPRILFDQVVAYYFRKGFSIPVSAGEFQEGLASRFSEADGMYFLPEQLVEYQKQKANVKDVEQLELFVTNEATAISWLRRKLEVRPQTYQEISPEFMQQLKMWNKYEEPLELGTLLKENFLCYDGNGEVPGPIHGYLSHSYKEFRNLAADDARLVERARDCWYMPDTKRVGDVEKLREKALLKEFEGYREAKKLKSFRIEAVKAGFKKYYEAHDYQTVLDVGGKLPGGVIEEDETLLMYYDHAQLHVEG